MPGPANEVLAAEVGQKGDIFPSRRMRGKVLDGRVRSKYPSLSVEVKLLGVVQVHLDQILVETVPASAPAAVAVLELTSLCAHLVSHQPGPSLGASRRVEEILLSLEDQVGVLVVSSQVTEVHPFEDQSTEARDAVVAFGELARFWVEDDVAFRHTTWGIEGNA